MPRIPGFYDTLEKLKKLQESKGGDYSPPDNPFDNFDFTEQVMSRFRNERDKTFVWPIATKLARLSNLLSNGNRPNNESIEDSFDDIANYIILWKCDYVLRNLRNRTTPQNGVSDTR